MCVGGSGGVFNLWFESGHSVCQVIIWRSQTHDAQNIDIFFCLFCNCTSFSIRIPCGSTNAMSVGAFDGKGVYRDDPLLWNGPGWSTACLRTVISNTHTEKACTRSMWSANRLRSFHHLYKMLNCQQLARSSTHFWHGRCHHMKERSKKKYNKTNK